MHYSSRTAAETARAHCETDAIKSLTTGAMDGARMVQFKWVQVRAGVAR